MSTANPLNVYSGSDSLKKYFDPDFQPPLPLVEIPDVLNPYRQDGVRIFAKMMTMLPANNVKALPAMGLLSNAVQPNRTKTVIEYSSGSTVISMSLISRVFHNIDDVRAYLSNKTSGAKLRLMQFFGLQITLFGGPSQPEPTDERGGIQRARVMSETDETISNPNQYENDANWKSHYRWTGPQILKQLPDISVICAGMGTSGTMTGIGTYFGDMKPSVVRVGVCTAAGDRVPGPRSYALMSPVLFPWRKAIDAMEEVGSPDSYRLSMQLSREGLVCGPSSGFNLQGLYQFLEKRKRNGTLKELAGPEGDIKCAFLCCDLPYQYIDEYFNCLGEDHFHPIGNKHLVNVDRYRYDEAWEKEPADAISGFFEMASAKSSAGSLPIPLVKLQQDRIIIDLRETADFNQSHLPGAVSLPIKSLTAATASPFYDSTLLADQWTELNSLLSPESSTVRELIPQLFTAKEVLVLCYNGDTSRIATSVLRSRSVAAQSCRGGTRRLEELLGVDSPRQSLDSGVKLDVNFFGGTVDRAASVSIA